MKLPWEEWNTILTSSLISNSILDNINNTCILRSINNTCILRSNSIST